MIDEGAGITSRFSQLYQTNLFACIILTLVSISLGINHVIGRGIHAEVPPVGLSFWRWLIGALILLPFTWRGIVNSIPLVRIHIGQLAFLGCMMIGSTTFILLALNFTTAINASIINATQPVWTVILAWLVLKEKMNPAKMIGVAMGLLGVIVMVTNGNMETIANLQFNHGDIFSLLAIIGFSIYAINIHKIPGGLTAAESLFIIIITGCLGLLPFYLIETLFFRSVPVTHTSLSAIITLALTISIFAMLGWNVGNRIIGPSKAGMFINLIPVSTAVLAIVFLGERLYIFHLFGVILISTGIYFVLRIRK